jgi:hypothetical protein
MQEPEANSASLSPFSAEFIASVLSKLPGEEVPPAEPGSQPLEQGHSTFLDSLLGHPTPSEPAILPAPGQFSLVGCIAESAAAVDGGGEGLPAVADEEAVWRMTPDLWAALNDGGEAGMPSTDVPQEVRNLRAG